MSHTLFVDDLLAVLDYSEREGIELVLMPTFWTVCCTRNVLPLTLVSPALPTETRSSRSGDERT